MTVDLELVGRMAVAHLEAAGLYPFPRPTIDEPFRRVWWEVHPETMKAMNAAMRTMAGAWKGNVGQAMLYGYPIHEARHIEPGYIALVEQIEGGIGLSYAPD